MRLIDADKLIKLLEEERYGYLDAIDILQQPTVEERPTGYWKDVTRYEFVEPLDTNRWFECSNCGVWSQLDISMPYRNNYCQNCGAKMDKNIN